MIPAVDSVLRSLLAETGAPCRLDLPGDDWSGLPTVSMLLHSITEDTDARYASWQDRRDSVGRVRGRESALRRYWFGYLVIAWAADPVAEHALAGAVLDALTYVESVPDEHLIEVPDAARTSVALSLACPEYATAMPLWHALGIGPRPVLPLKLAATMTRETVDLPDAPSGIDLGMGEPPAPPKPPVPTVPRPTKRISEGAR